MKALFDNKLSVQGSPFVDKEHNHIITGNSKVIIISCSKDRKYRENRIADYEKAKESIITGIKSYIQSWFNKHDVTTSSFFK